jgi:hypothetical protein
MSWIRPSDGRFWVITEAFLRRALKMLAFVPSARARSYWWGISRFSPKNRFHLTFLRGDDGIRPYPQ